jgi:hypothetical protein
MRFHTILLSNGKGSRTPNRARSPFRLTSQRSYSNRRAHVLSIEGAKTDATRRLRIDKSVSTPAAGNIR